MDMNSFVWVSEKQIGALGGARFSFSATLPIANNSLSSDTAGALSGGGGFADSMRRTGSALSVGNTYVLPLTPRAIWCLTVSSMDLSRRRS